MKVRTRDGQWTYSQHYALHVLGLDGTGALRPVRIAGVLHIRRGGTRLSALRSTTRHGVDAD